MTCNTSAVAVCWSSASRASVSRRSSDLSHPHRLAQEISKWPGEATRRDGTEPIAVGYMQATGCSTAEAMSLLQDRVEHRREVAGRGVDDLQYLGGRGLLLQCLARLGQEPRVLHRND